jgi:hypothetical protein
MTGKTKQEWLDKAKLFNELAAKVKADGMLSATTPMRTTSRRSMAKVPGTFSLATPSPRSSCSSIPAIVRGRRGPVAVLKKYPGRAKTIHIKANGGDRSSFRRGQGGLEGRLQFCERRKGGTQW